MKRTVYAFARTRRGIIAVRKAGETQWHFLEIKVLPNESDWKRSASRGFENATSIHSDPQDWSLVVSKVSENGSKGRKRETIYAQVLIPDPEIGKTLPARGKDGHQVEEVTYWRAENSKNLRLEERDFLLIHDLLGPF